MNEKHPLAWANGLAIVLTLSWAQTSVANPVYSANANIVDVQVVHYSESQFGSLAPVSFMGTHMGSSAATPKF